VTPAKPSPGTRTVIYARASTGEQASSCDQQVKECSDKAKALGFKVAEVFKDDGISGTRRDRPAYQRLLAAADAKEFDTLILWKQSRLGRDSVEVERAIRHLEFRGLRLITCDGYDTSASTEKSRKIVRGIKGLMDESYIDDLREDVLRGLTTVYSKGYWTGGRPYGYRLVEITSPTEKDTYGHPKRIGSRLEIDPKQAKIVQEIFQRYADGASPQSIAADLNKREIPSPGSAWKRKVRRCAGWARSAIWAMLPNPLYNGTYLWKRAQWVKTETGRQMRPRASSEWVGEAGNAPDLQIIKPALWKLVQVRLGVNKLKPDDRRLRSGGKAVFLLSGLLKCECGANFVMCNAHEYKCGRALDGESCPKSVRMRVRRELAEEVILKPITEELLAPDMVEQMVVEMRAYYAKQMDAARAAQAERPAAVLELDARIERLRKRIKDGDPDMSAEDLQAIIDKAEAKKRELLSSAPEAKRNDKILAAMPAAAKQYRDQIKKGLQGNPTEAGRGRIAVRQLLGDSIVLKPAKDRSHLVAHLTFRRAALVGNVGVVGSVGSGGALRIHSPNLLSPPQASVGRDRKDLSRDRRSPWPTEHSAW
jgi:DNA invertase Pin-like site-specific DNA recombinase